MQKYILIIFTFVFPLSLFADEKTEIVLDWDCKSVNYEGEVQRLPDRARVKAEIKIKDDGRFDIKLKDNIFKEGLEEKVTGFIGGLFGNKKEKTHAVDYTQCLTRFKYDFIMKLEAEHAQMCSGNANCPSEQELVLDFNSTLEDQKIVKRMNDLPKVPRYFTGHNESYINFNVREKLIEYCEENKDVSLEILLSRQFIEQVANEVINLNPIANDDCLRKVEGVLKEHNGFTSCEGENYPCNVIADANFLYSDENLNFRENKEKLISEKAKEEQEQRRARENEVLRDEGYITDAPTETARKFREKLEEDIAYNGDKSDSYCWSSYTITDRNRRQSIFNYDNLIQENMAFIRENFKPACLDNFIENYIAHKYKNDDPLLNELCQSHDCAFIRENKQLFEENLNGLIQYTFGDAAVEYSCQNPVEYGSDFKDVRSLLANMRNVNMCSPLEVGETKVVEDFATTGVKMRYALKRNSTRELQANVVINFETPDADATETQESMMARTKECLETTSSYFNSPNGETIRVNVLTPDEANALPQSERPRVNNVGIGDPEMRSNSGKYASNTGCGTITHEVLHLMGLCDEYRETQRGYYVNTLTGETVNEDDEAAKSDENVEFVLAYNECRAISETPSIMSSHWDALRFNTASKSSCTCIEGRESRCARLTNEAEGNSKLLDFSIRNPFDYMNQYNDICETKTIASKPIYNESELNDFTVTPTRQIIYNNSVTINMHSLNLAASGGTIGHMNSYRFQCQCTEGDSSCMNRLKNLKEDDLASMNQVTSSCPFPLFGAKKNSEFNEMISRDELEGVESAVNVIGSNEIQIIKPPTNPNATLLHPAHFTRIKYGSCQEKAQTYSMCAKYAYKGLAKDCPDRPAACDEEDQWLLSDQ
tara:strand:+ start:168959 stop:171610 length:2652 start_codon:yes stop_codon:yes gene_type:complete